ncbi:heterokaryon incompatibility protein-domain-containing protein [Ustulina deusta]|nr:heterokaryon incompatibility protein-domain-containing protein [Ustulina deusta]
MGDAPEHTANPTLTGGAAIIESQDSATPPPSQPSLAEFYKTLPLPNAKNNAKKNAENNAKKKVEKHIRLLHLDASAQEILTGRLYVASLSNSPRFDALSYVWACHIDRTDCGPGGGCCELNGPYAVQCGRARVPITKNGYLALQSLTKQLGPITIWVDSICINQGDKDERSEQVKLMKDIYSFAQTTYIWLDDTVAASNPVAGARAASDTAFNNLATSFRRFKYQHGVLETFLFSHPMAFKFWNHDGESQPLIEARSDALQNYKDFIWSRLSFPLRKLQLIKSSPHLEHAYQQTDLENLLRRPWFQRAWTFQEFVLSHHPVMLCQNRMLDCDFFFKMISYPALYRTFPTQNYKSSPINGVIRSLRHRESTDPRDKSYSLYGILGTLDPNSSSAWLSEPDYDKSKSAVYLELLSDLLEWQPDLVRLLMDAGIGQLPHPGPSWVPDWSPNGPRTWLDETYVYGTNSYSATSKVPANLRIEEFELFLRGVMTGSCQNLTVIPYQSNLGIPATARRETALEDSTLRSLLRWLKVVQLEAGVQPVNHHLHQAVYEVLTGKIQEENPAVPYTPWIPTLRHPEQEQPNSQEIPFHGWFRIMMTEAVRGEGSRSLEELKNEITKGPAILGWHNEYITAIQGRRSLFVDSEGHLGSGPLYMREGDQIALLAGLHVPAILRLANNGNEEVTRYYFVGPAFVCGMMKGEERSGNEQFTEFRLV